jgi:hypothetical protein
MSDLDKRLIALAEECRKSDPLVASCLYSLAGALLAGGPWLLSYADATQREALALVQFCDGDGESVS